MSHLSVVDAQLTVRVPTECEEMAVSRNEHTMSMYEGENYLLFNAITSAGEPDPNTGLARPGDEQGEQMLNGIYGVVTVTHRVENGQFTQNI